MKHVWIIRQLGLVQKLVKFVVNKKSSNMEALFVREQRWLVFVFAETVVAATAV